MFAPKELDREKCIKMALVHDVAEAVIGDITPVDGRYTKAMKHKMEEEALIDITKDIGEVGQEIVALWKELEVRETAEAKFVKDLDRLDLLLTGTMYIEEDKSKRDDISWIYSAATENYNTDLAKGLEAEILKKEAHHDRDY